MPKSKKRTSSSSAHQNGNGYESDDVRLEPRISSSGRIIKSVQSFNPATQPTRKKRKSEHTNDAAQAADYSNGAAQAESTDISAESAALAHAETFVKNQIKITHAVLLTAIKQAKYIQNLEDVLQNLLKEQSEYTQTYHEQFAVKMQDIITNFNNSTKYAKTDLLPTFAVLKQNFAQQDAEIASLRQDAEYDAQSLAEKEEKIELLKQMLAGKEAEIRLLQEHKKNENIFGEEAEVLSTSIFAAIEKDILENTTAQSEKVTDTQQNDYKKLLDSNQSLRDLLDQETKKFNALKTKALHADRVARIFFPQINSELEPVLNYIAKLGPKNDQQEEMKNRIEQILSRTSTILQRMESVKNNTAMDGTNGHHGAASAAGEPLTFRVTESPKLEMLAKVAEKQEDTSVAEGLLYVKNANSNLKL